MPNPTAEQALAAITERLGERSAAHSRAVAETAEALAIGYGIDTTSAYLAGLLHDWCREVAGEVLLETARARGWEITPVDAAVPYLLHARVACVELSDEFPGIEEDILEAVERHTVGAPDMTPLDMCVYVADMIEPGRSYPGVEGLRGMVGRVPMTELYSSAYRVSLAHLLERGAYIHPSTVETWNAIVERGVL